MFTGGVGVLKARLSMVVLLELEKNPLIYIFHQKESYYSHSYIRSTKTMPVLMKLKSKINTYKCRYILNLVMLVEPWLSGVS